MSRCCKGRSGRCDPHLKVIRTNISRAFLRRNGSSRLRNARLKLQTACAVLSLRNWIASFHKNASHIYRVRPPFQLPTSFSRGSQDQGYLSLHIFFSNHISSSIRPSPIRRVRGQRDANTANTQDRYLCPSATMHPNYKPAATLTEEQRKE